MIEKDIKITSYDVQANSVVKFSSLQKYMQQLAREDLMQFGVTYYGMREDNQVFVLVKLAMEFEKDLMAEETVKIRTWQKEIKGATYTREFEFYRDGEKVGAASTHWVILDFEKRTIVKPEKMSGRCESFPELSSGVEIERRLIENTDELVYTGTYKVMYCDLDENNHLNNTVYPDIVINFSPLFDENGFHPSVKRMQINFAAEAKLGDELDINILKTENGFKSRVHNKTEDKNCFDIEFMCQ